MDSLRDHCHGLLASGLIRRLVSYQRVTSESLVDWSSKRILGLALKNPKDQPTMKWARRRPVKG